jgi:hypothetical protein
LFSLPLLRRAENVAEGLFSFFLGENILPGSALWLRTALRGAESDWGLIGGIKDEICG